MAIWGRSRSGCVALTAIVGLGAIAGCGGGGGSSSGSSSGGGESASTIKTQITTGKAKGEIDHLSWALPTGEPATLDPTESTTYGTDMTISNLCDTFMRQRPDTTLYPHLGTLDRQSPTRYVFTLKKGIDFWDAHEATGEDLRFSLAYAARPESIGALAYENVSSIKKSGPYQVTVTLKSPDVLFERELGSIYGSPLIEKEFTEKAGENFGTADGGIMCSGPFELTDWKPGQEIDLTRNENYFDPAGKPHAKTVSLKFLSDSTALAQGLASGEVEGAYGVPAAILPQLSKSSNGKLYYGETQENLLAAVATPTTPLNEPKLLEALSLSINRPAVAETIYHGAAQPNYTFLSKTMWPPEDEAPWEAAYPKYEKERQYDPEAAKKLVEESDYEGEPLKTVIPAGNETISQFAQLLQQEAAKVGIKLEIKPEPPTQYATMSYTASARKGVDLYVSQEGSIIKNPLELLPVTLTPGEYYNYTNYDNPKVTALLDKARETLNDTERSEMLAEVQSIFESEPSSITVVAVYTDTYLSNKLTGAVTAGIWKWTPSLAPIGPAE